MRFQHQAAIWTAEQNVVRFQQEIDAMAKQQEQMALGHAQQIAAMAQQQEEGELGVRSMLARASGKDREIQQLQNANQELKTMLEATMKQKEDWENRY